MHTTTNHYQGQFLKVAQMLGAAAALSKPVSAELLLASGGGAETEAVSYGGGVISGYR